MSAQSMPMPETIEEIHATWTERLAKLRTAYEADRAARDGASPPTATTNRCRYCGRGWRRLMGSKFDGHVTCIVSSKFIDDVVDVLDSGVTYEAVAEALGISSQVVRAWWNHAKNPGRKFRT